VGVLVEVWGYEYNGIFIDFIESYPGWWFQPWWYTYPSGKYYLSWDDYSQYMEKIKNVPNHQSV